MTKIITKNNKAFPYEKKKKVIEREIEKYGWK